MLVISFQIADISTFPKRTPFKLPSINQQLLNSSPPFYCVCVFFSFFLLVFFSVVTTTKCAQQIKLQCPN